MAQVQCPNCGGYRTLTEKVQSITQANTRLEPQSKRYYYSSSIIAIVILLAIGIFLLSIPAFLYNIMGGIAIVGVIYCVVIMIVEADKRGKQNRNQIYVRKVETTEVAKSYEFRCQLCGYRWLWRTDESYPKVNVRPDLIAIGNQRLEEEERKQQEAAAWLYWEEQRKKNQK